jgi:two-component system NarL family response regulator
MGQGLSNQQIAAALGISLGTVRVHGHAIMQKLGVANRTQAVLKLRG